MEDLPPDVHTIDLWIDGRFARRMSREVFEEERAVAELVMPFLHDGLKYFEQNDVPPPALRGPSSSVPPNRTLIEDERTARDLVPLVRAAADEVPVGDVPHLPGYDDLRRACLEDEVRLRVQHEINEHIAAALINAPIRTVPAPPPPPEQPICGAQAGQFYGRCPYMIIPRRHVCSVRGQHDAHLCPHCGLMWRDIVTTPRELP